MSRMNVNFRRVTTLAMTGVMASVGVLPATAQQSTKTDATRTVVEREITIREREEKIVERKREGNPVKVAIFVKNRVGAIPDDRIAGFEDRVSARLMTEGFQILRRENVLNTVKDFGGEGPNRGNEALSGAQLDQMLSNNSTAMRLAQNLEAEFILNCSIAALDSEPVEFESGGDKFKQSNVTLEVTYEILYAGDGAGFRGDVVTVKRKYTVPEGQKLPATSVDSLLRDAAAELAKTAKAGLVSRFLPAAKSAGAEAPFEVVCRVANFEIPEVVRDANGQVVIGEKQRPQILNVTVELNGVVIGTSPGSLRASPGLQKLRLRREGFKDFEGTVRITPGQVLNIDLEMTVEQEARMLQRAAFFERMKSNTKLTDAEVEVLGGYAQFLRQSGLKWDVKVDYKENNTGTRTETKTETKTESRSESRSEPATQPAR